MRSPEISVGGLLITILGLFFEKPVLWQHFVGNARENTATAHARGNTRACIFFSEIGVNNHIYPQNKFYDNWKQIGEDKPFYK